jgi:acetolactate decarboxylase
MERMKVVKVLMVFISAGVLFFGCAPRQQEQNNAGGEANQWIPAEVHSAGALRQVMAMGDLNLHIRADTLDLTGLIAVGPLGRLQGEVSILDGVTYITRIDENGEANTQLPDRVEGPFMAWAHVQSWEPLGELFSIADLKDLEQQLAVLAQDRGVDSGRPFPFFITGVVEQLDWHVISKPLDELEHSHDLHKQAKVSFQYANGEVELLGFYSRKHEGIFTHMGDYIHVHAILPDGSTGHVDNLLVQGSVRVWIGI